MNNKMKRTISHMILYDDGDFHPTNYKYITNG